MTLDPVAELRTRELEAGKAAGIRKRWLGDDHIGTMHARDEGTPSLDHASFNVDGRPKLVRLFRTERGAPVVEINGKPHAIELKSYRGMDGFQKLLNSDDLFDFLINPADKKELKAAPKAAQPFSPRHSPGYGLGITFAESLDARIREAHSQGGTLSAAQVAEWIAKNPDKMTSYSCVALPFRPEVFFKAYLPEHMARLDEMCIVPRTHPVTKEKLTDVPEPERVTYVTRNGRNVVQTIGIDSTGNGEEKISVNRLLNVKMYPGCASVNPRLTVINPELPQVNEVSHPAMDFEIGMNIYRAGNLLWSGSYRASDSKRSDNECFREIRQTQGKPKGGSPFFAFMGTGTVPPMDFSVEPGDRVVIYSPELGILDVTVRPVLFDESIRSIR